ncbi:MAG TPA: MATE family efflux transporter [Alphaproteobacteria bacterium]|nr:MATE family efflux transporter [Alphaproteobacteria bacterium]
MTTTAPGRARPSPLRTHLSELLRLSVPVVVSRTGVMSMALVDAIMVGRYSATELAYQSIGGAMVAAVLTTLLGLLMGTLVLTARAYGAGDYLACGAVWRRALPYGFALGLVGSAICLFGEALLLLTGQSAELAAGGGPVMLVIGLGLPANQIMIASSFFLEGIKRPMPVMVLTLFANLLNVLLNWVFVYGHLGFPEGGAVGSAWATTAGRWVAAFAYIAFIWTMRDQARFGVRLRPAGGWSAWAEQRRLGFAAGASIGLETAAFSAVSLFAGWLGATALAAFSIGLNLVAIVFMVALGIGAATAVRTGAAHGEGNLADVARAGWIGLAAASVAMALGGMVFQIVPVELAAVFTHDPVVVAAAAPVVAFAAYMLVADGGQAVMANALRGRGDAWVPTALHMFSYFGVMVPLSWLLAFPLGRGLQGLFEGLLIASVVSVAVLAARFWWLSLLDRRAEPAAAE